MSGLGRLSSMYVFNNVTNDSKSFSLVVFFLLLLFELSKQRLRLDVNIVTSSGKHLMDSLSWSVYFGSHFHDSIPLLQIEHVSFSSEL